MPLFESVNRKLPKPFHRISVPVYMNVKAVPYDWKELVDCASGNDRSPSLSKVAKYIID